MDQTTETKPKVHNINKPAYLILLMAGIYFLIQKEFSQAVTFFGLALVFDPFNTEIPFNKRPVYQQLWLFIHLSITLALIVLEIIVK
jgi:hypothetical protein